MAVSCSPVAGWQAVGEFWDVGFELKILSPATANRARSKRVGNFLPRLSARRRMPAAASALKKNRWWTWSSKTSDNVDATASLGHSEMLAVQHTPRHAIPEFGKRFDDDAHVLTFARRHEARNVLDKEPSGLEYSRQPGELEEEARPFPPLDPFPLPGVGEVLAGEPSEEEINAFELSPRDRFDVAIPCYLRPVACKDAPPELIDLDLPRHPDSGLPEAEVEPAHSAEA